MPFTIAHAAASLPIWYASRKRFRLAALVFGCATPDYIYFLHLNTVGHFGHTLPGLILVCLPAGWFSLWLFDRFGRRGVETLLPATWHLPPAPVRPYPLLLTSVALLLGAVSHIVWDAFTHESGWGVRMLPALATSAHIGHFSVPWFKVLQHGSTLLGLGVLAIACRRWVRSQPRLSLREGLRRALPPLAFLCLAGVLNGLRFMSGGLQKVVVAGGVAVTLTFGLGLVILGATSPSVLRERL
jgi:hypothetical protein